MIGFRGGPAEGLTLLLRRAPHYLRIVEGEDGALDALDQLDDAPRDDERVHVYVRPGEADPIHIHRGGADGRWSGWTFIAMYVWIDVDGSELRDADAWRAWVLSQPRAGQGRVGDTTWPPRVAGTEDR